MIFLNQKMLFKLTKGYCTIEGGVPMQFGSEDYQLEDSYFVIVHPFTYVVLGILGLVGVIIFMTLIKRKNRKLIVLTTALL